MAEQPNADSVRATIAAIEARPVGSMTFTEGRYPYTYAYDYLRSHHEDFGLPRDLSRADCAALFRGNDDKDALCILLADAYLREYRIERPAQIDGSGVPT